MNSFAVLALIDDVFIHNLPEINETHAINKILIIKIFHQKIFIQFFILYLNQMNS